MRKCSGQPRYIDYQTSYMNYSELVLTLLVVTKR